MDKFHYKLISGLNFMKFSFFLFSLFFLLGFSVTSYGVITINFQAAQFLDSNGNPIATGSKAILVADTDGSGFAGDYVNAIADFSAFNGLNLAQGQTLPSSTNEILLVLDAQDLGGVQGFNGVLNSFSLTSTVTGGDEIGLYWFPSEFLTSITGPVSEYGFFRSDTFNAVFGETSGFFVPADGNTESIGAFDTNLGGTFSPVALTAIPIPEPGTYAALIGAFAIGLVLIVRRKVRS